MTQHEKMLEIMHAGVWVPTEVFEQAYIRDHRKRFSELRREYPERFETRMRKRSRCGRPLADRRDTSRDDEIRKSIRSQVRDAREDAADHPSEHRSYVISVDTYVLKTITSGQVCFYSLDEITRRLFAEYIESDAFVLSGVNTLTRGKD